MRRFLCVLLAVLPAGTTCPLWAATIVGSTVTGSLLFGGNTTFNGFSTANGGSGTTAIIGPGVEFTYADAYNTDTANFSANGLRITDAVAVNAQSFTMSFADSAFTGFTLVSSNGGFSYVFSGNTLIVNFAGSSVPGAYAATFDYASAATPEPASLDLLATGLLGLGTVGSHLRRRARVFP